MMKPPRRTHPAISICAWALCYPVAWYAVVLVGYHGISAVRGLPANPSGITIAAGYFAGICGLAFLVTYPVIIILALTRVLPGTRRVCSDLCQHCGYAREGLAPRDPCPECGQMHKPRRYHPMPAQRKLERLESIHNARHARGARRAGD